MVNIITILKGNGLFLMGYGFAVISQWIFPILVDFLNDKLGGLVWLGIILTWVLALIIIPLGLIIYGLTEKSESRNMFGMIFGILYGLFAMLLAYFTYFWTATLTSILEYPLLVTLFWVGYIIIFIMNIIIVPVVHIIEVKQQG